MSKHLWILNHYAHSPSETGGPTRHHTLAKYLEHHGWRTTIIAASTEHPSGQQREVTAGALTVLVDGVPFVWVRTPSYSGNGFDRMLNMLVYGLRLVTGGPMRGLDRPDAILGSSPHPAAPMVAAWLSWRLKVPFIYEVRDLWPQALIEMGRIRESSLTARIMRRIEAYLFRTAKRSVVLWPNVVAYLKERGIKAADPVWISNGIDCAAIPQPSPPPERSGFTLMYLGAHGGANGLDNVIRAMRIVQDRAPDRDIQLRLVGDGPRKPALMALAKKLGSRNINFEDAVEKRDVPAVAVAADAFIFNLIGAPMFRFGISPNKLFEYMAAQRPVIFCCDAFNNPIAECGGGISARPGDPEELADAILELADLPAERRAEMGLAARRHVEAHYDFKALASELAKLLDGATLPPAPK